MDGEATGGPRPPLDWEVVAAAQKRQRNRLLGRGAMALVVIVLVLAAIGHLKSRLGPEVQAQDLLTALAAGDADGVLEATQIDDSPENALLTRAMVKTIDSKIDRIELREVKTKGDRAVVTMTYSVDGRYTEQKLTVEKVGARFGVFDRWKVTPQGLGALTVNAPGASSIKVNGVTIGAPAGSLVLPVFPGVYDIKPKSPSTFLDFEGNALIAGPYLIAENREDLDFTLKPSERLLPEVGRQLDAILADCITRRESRPKGCPNQTYFDFDLGKPSWKLLKKPTYNLVGMGDGRVVFLTHEVGEAEISGHFSDNPDETYTRPQRIGSHGVVKVSGDKVTLEIKDRDL